MATGKEIFVSYGREPEVTAFVTLLKHDLEAQDFSVWLDTEDIPAGSDWHAAIGTGLAQCSALIAVITSKYLDSKFCTNELYTASSDHKKIFPVILENIDFSASDRARGVKYVIGGINWSMFRSGYDDYQISVERLMQGMREQGLGGGSSSQTDGPVASQLAQLHLSPTPSSSSPSPSPSAPPPATHLHYPTPPTVPIQHGPAPNLMPGQQPPYYPYSPPQGYGAYPPQPQPIYPYPYPPTTPPQPPPTSHPYYPSPPQPPPTSHLYYPPTTPPQPPPTSHPYYPPTTPPQPPPTSHPYYPPLPMAPNTTMATGVGVGDAPPPYSATATDGPSPAEDLTIPKAPLPSGQEYTDSAPLQTTPTRPRPSKSESSSSSLLSSESEVDPSTFEVGMKLEAVDRRFPYFVCVATIMDRSDSEVLIHFDGWGPEYDYWCPSCSPELHPPGWCQSHGWELQKPLSQGWTSWEYYLGETDSPAAPETLFSEDQLEGLGSLLFQPDMKLEAKDKQNPQCVCVATVANIKDGKLLIHFDGWTSRYDYWCRPDSNDIHPPHWSGKNHRELQPPRGHEGRFKWSEYPRQPGPVPALAHIFTEEQRAILPASPAQAQQQPKQQSFKEGMRLEAKDRKYPTLTCVASISTVRDGKLLIHFDGWGNDYDYWCDVDSTDIHPVGWCTKNGQQLQQPKGHVGEFNWNTYLHLNGLEPAPVHLFTEAQKAGHAAQAQQQPKQHGFKVGMRLEAKDRKYPTLTCVASISTVRDGKLLIHFDGWGNDYDYWCDVDSTDIHPVGWSEKNETKLQKPKGHVGEFKWSTYLQQNGFEPAPAHLFTGAQKAGHAAQAQQQPKQHGFKVGMRLEAKDRKYPTLTCVASISTVRDGKLLIHFDGWSNDYDYWCDVDSTDIHPVGWCTKNGLCVQQPNGHVGEFNWNTYLRQNGVEPATVNLFTEAQIAGNASSPSPHAHPSSPPTRDMQLQGLKEGMRLEAKDRKNPMLTCVATISAVRDGKLLIHFDGWGNNYDYWCDVDSTDIHPVGWCKSKDLGQKLQKPKGHVGEFQWNTYLREQRAVPAPVYLFSPAQRL